MTFIELISLTLKICANTPSSV